MEGQVSQIIMVSRRKEKIPLICRLMVLVGLTGGLASGKSTVANLFQKCGAKIIDADQIARTVVQPGKAAWKDIVQAFGKTILHKDRTLNRKALGERVFHDPRQLKRLNQIVHPRVAREQARIVNSMARTDPDAVIIYDAALLIEAKAHERMDRVILVTADRQTQVARACKRDGLSRRAALARLRGQLSLREKKRYADDVIDGTLPRAQLFRKVRHLYRELLTQSRQRSSSLKKSSREGHS